MYCIRSEEFKGNFVFYEGILGIKPSLERPQLDVTGVWYDSDSKRISFVMNRMLGGREKGVTDSCEVLTFTISNIEIEKASVL